MRIRIIFSKTEVIRFTSHLDLYRGWERTMRRGELPLAYSQGFKPHSHINLACALPLGFTSENDLVDIWLAQNIPIEEILAQLKKSAPPGIVIKSVEEIAPQAPSLQRLLKASEYSVTLLQFIDNLKEKIEKILNTEIIMRQRNNKDYNLRPLIIDLGLQANDLTGWQQIMMVLQAQESATGRPEEVLLTLGIDPTTTSIHRRRLILCDSPK